MCLFQQQITDNLCCCYITVGAQKTEKIGINVENKHIHGQEINLGCLIITLNHRFLVFNFSCGVVSGINIDLGPQQTLQNIIYLKFDLMGKKKKKKNFFKKQAYFKMQI